MSTASNQKLRAAAGAGLALLLGAAPIATASAQDATLAPTSRISESSGPSEKNALEKGRYAILVDLDENRLYFKQGDLTLWSAPVGTGTGMRVITHEDDWKFTTPQGRFQVQYKERDPVWIAPDWFFVENNLPIPANDHPSRYMKGTLGVAALYIAPDLAIHGTNRPELIGQRVSHGCIRLENRYALRLYNSIQVGTEVIIVGGDEVEKNGQTVDLREGYDPVLGSKGKLPPPPADPLVEIWKGQDTEMLVGILGDELREDPKRSQWDEVVGILLDRIRDEDEDAMEGLFSAVHHIERKATDREFSAFIAEAYRSNPVLALEALADLDREDRDHAARMLVAAMVTLYPGDIAGPSTPWPSRRLPASAVSRQGRRGWEAILEAEASQREEATLADATV